jgi:hypothetical protein
MLAIDSLLSIGLYRVDLWELAEAANLFRQVIQQSQNTSHQGWADKASICLAWVNSYLGRPLSIDELAETAIAAQSEEGAGRFAVCLDAFVAEPCKFSVSTSGDSGSQASSAFLVLKRY